MSTPVPAQAPAPAAPAPAPVPGPASAPAPVTVRDLHARGELAREYPAVRGALARAGGRELDFAGRVLAQLDPGAVLAAHPGTPRVRIAVTGRATVGEVVPPLTAQAARHGLLVLPYVGGGGGYVGELGNPASALYAHEPEVTLCVLDPLTVWHAVEEPWQPLDVTVAAERQRKLLGELAAAHAAYAPRGATLVLNTVPLLRRFTHQLTGLAQRAELGGLWREFNADLLYMSDPGAGLAVLDLEPLIASGVRADDPRLGAYADAHCTTALLTAYASEAAHLVRALRGAAKKCLVLDLDGTLWDGVLAEEGPEGLSASGTLRGAAFGAFQRTVKQLASQGVLLAVCSKNDPEPVARALAEHPEFPLGADDFLTVVADWGSKAQGVRTIAARLGIAPESVVFADDTPFERETVHAGVPGAAVVPLDAEPALHIEHLLADGWFDTPTLTDEDRMRPSRYTQREERARFQAGATDHQAFLHSLDLRAEIAPARDHEAARLAQLSLRTNRFNLTGTRLTPARVRALAEGTDSLALTVRTADRFGDDGVIGAVFARIDAQGLHLENLVLSCRVLGRGIEEATLSGLLYAAQAAGLPAVHGTWRRTRANAALAALYPDHGFRPTPGPPGAGAGPPASAGPPGATSGPPGAEEAHFRHDLERIPPVPAHVRLRLRLTEAEVETCTPSRT
ncbi:HAD-IIIC family phosphatase [Streptomyces iconiensis]|uniref:HAD-IIIC family phosphatase n=1 Tax=Streptomyces iconiensis TaxID=1384038 RepID=A0ABT6ZXY3_9ACTN|nr:HAD-IIIC family phosphatase [Streptomyces iconiensis]MDJ1133927.1 HAD-IIIC family phosphatase [Streptomyces iconiensis]